MKKKSLKRECEDKEPIENSKKASVEYKEDEENIDRKDSNSDYSSEADWSDSFVCYKKKKNH